MNELRLEKAIKTILYLIPLTALIYFQGFFFPFIITKTVYFRFLVQIAFSLYLYLLALDFKAYRPKINWALILVSAWLLINFIAAIFGLDFYKSFWSDFERFEGLLGLLYLTAYLFLLLNFFKTKKDWLINIRIFSGVSVLVALYGIVQRFDILPVFEAGASRAASTLGNAAFLAGFALLSLGLSAYAYFKETEKKYRYLALAAAVLNFITIFLTLTRGAILGLAVGLVVYLILRAVFASGRARKYSLGFLALILIISAGIYLGRGSLANSRINFISRLASISLSEGTAKDRLLVWRWALNGWRERPILGVGLENFNIVYDKYFTPEVSEDWFDRTHNIYLDQLISSGLAGLAAYLAILAYLFWRLFKRRQDDFILFSVFSALLAAYIVHNFFVFDVLTTALTYFFIIGFVGFKEEAEKEVDSADRPLLAKTVTLFLIIANLYILYQAFYLPLFINRNLYIGYRYVIADTELSRQSFALALNYKFGSVEAAGQLSRMYDLLEADPTIDKEELKKYYELTVDKLRFAMNNYPLDDRPKLFFAQEALNHYKEKSELTEIEEVARRAVELSPTRPEAVYLLFNVYLQEGQKDKAIVAMEELINKLPWFGEPKILLANAIHKSEPAKAKIYFDEGIKQTYRHSRNVLNQIIPYLLDNQRYQEAIPQYLELIAGEPSRYEYRVDLSKLYYLTGDLNSAIEQINIVNAKSPATLKNFQDYLNILMSEYDKGNK